MDRQVLEVDERMNVRKSFGDEWRFGWYDVWRFWGLVGDGLGGSFSVDIMSDANTYIKYVAAASK